MSRDSIFKPEAISQIKKWTPIALFYTLVVGTLITTVLGLAILNRYYPALTGFGEGSSTNVERGADGKVIKTVEVGQSGKTLWDWLSVLGVPLSLAVLGYWLQQLRRKGADEEAKEEVLQAYFDRLSTLLIDKNLIAMAIAIQDQNTQPRQGLADLDEETLKVLREQLNAMGDVIKARTLSILRRLGKDTQRKESVIRFLAETQIISKLQLDLSGADLSGVDLSHADLSHANLNNANLQGANLHRAYLEETQLRDANLQGANLRRASLARADLRRARGLTDQQLSKAKICETGLPEYSKLDGDRDCAKLSWTDD